MTIYVDELPKSCIDCPCESEYYCNLLNRDIEFLELTKGCNDCPLKLLKDHDRAVKQHAYKKGYNDMRIQYELGDYTKQVRKEVVQEIWKEFEQRLMNKTEDMPVIKVANMINSVLDQIQGE